MSDNHPEQSPKSPPAEETKPLGTQNLVTTIASPQTPAALVDGNVLRSLGPPEIRARRRPRAIFFVWAYELVCAFFIAAPLHAWARQSWGAHPDGDAPLFRPGGHALISWLGDDSSALSIVFRVVILSLLLFGLLGQIVTGTVVGSLATGLGKSGRAPPLSFGLRVGAASFFPMLLVGIISGAIEGFVLGIGLFASSAVDHGFVHSVGDARAWTFRLITLAVFVLAMLMVGVVADLWRVAILHGEARRSERGEPQLTIRRRLHEGLILAMRTARKAIGTATLAWGWRAAIAFILIYIGSLAGDFTGAKGGGALWLLFFVHQLIILARAGLRASWLANALRLLLVQPRTSKVKEDEEAPATVATTTTAT